MRPAAVALAHLRRRPGKALIVLAGLAVAAAIVVSLLDMALTMGEELSRELEGRGARVLISPVKQDWTLSYSGLTLGSASFQAQELPVWALDRARETHPEVAPKLLHVTTGPDGEAVLAVGVDWSEERRLRTHWSLEGRYPEAAGEVLLGSELASQWDVRQGATIRLFGRAYEVAGVLDETGLEEDGVVLMSLTELQDRAGRPGSVTFIEASAPGPAAGKAQGELKDRLAAALPGTEVTLVRDVEEARLGLLDRIRSLIPVTAVLAVAAGSFLVAAQQYAMARERTREVGLLRAFGYREGHIMAVLLTEVLAVACAAAVLGWSAGTALAGALLPLLDPASGALGLRLDPKVFAAVLAGSAAVGLTAAYWPVRRAARTDPASALRML